MIENYTGGIILGSVIILGTIILCVWSVVCRWLAAKPEVCVHEWDKVSEETLPSLVDMVKESTHSIKLTNVDHPGRTHILVLQCKKCGKLDKTVTHGG